MVGKIHELTVEYQRSALFPESYGSNKPVLVNEQTGETVAIFAVEEGGGMRDVILTLPEPYTVPGNTWSTFLTTASAAMTTWTGPRPASAT